MSRAKTSPTHLCGALLILLSLAGASSPRGQGGRAAVHAGKPRASRLGQLAEANVIAVHAYQILLAKKEGKGDPACYSPGKLSDAELQSIVAHQRGLLKSDPAALRAWARGASSVFDPAKDLGPILSAGLVVPPNAPVNVYTDYLRRHVKADPARTRSVANLYQTVLEIERDGDVLQDEYAFYIGVGLPVYIGQLGLPGDDAALLAAGRQLAKETCASPFDTGAVEWQMGGRKIWNWGLKNLHIRDERVLAAELLREGDVKALVPRIRALPAERVAVIGHSFTMGLHWASPSAFVPIVTDIFRRENPGVEFRQYAAGGLTPTRARQRFYYDALAWKPEKVLLVLLPRTDEDYDALRQMTEGFTAAGAKVYMFDRILSPSEKTPGSAERAADVARAAGATIIEVGDILDASPDRGRFQALNDIHMTEPYHRLMAKEWLKFLVGARGAKRDENKN